MHKQIYVNLAVDDLERSKAFFSAIGLSFEPRFTNGQAACLILGEDIYAMLLVKHLFKSFTAGSLAALGDLRFIALFQIASTLHLPDNAHAITLSGRRIIEFVEVRLA